MTTDPKRTGLRATPVVFDDAEGYPAVAAPGSFELTHGGRTMLLACPGCGSVSGMRVGDPKPVPGPSWHMTGPPDAPTLAPSVNCVGCCGWHGHLRNGAFESC